MKNYLKKNICNFIVVFLIIFMLGIFGPSEIYFGNYKELGFIFSEFGWKFLVIGILFSIIATVLVSLLPDKIQRIVDEIIFAITTAAYIQVMFLNADSDMIGATAEGYRAGIGEIIKNTSIWLCVFGMIFLLLHIKKEKWKKIIGIGSAILLGIQMVAYGSLFLTAPKETFQYEKGETILSSEDQFKVSKKENIIIILLDNFSSTWLDVALRTYPELLDDFPDFTYYDNTNCDYYSTYPSFTRLVTGNEFDPNLSVNDYTYDSWTNEETERYYDILHQNGYYVNIYTEDASILVGGNSLDIAKGKLDNVIETGSAIIVDHRLMTETLLKMSLYRYAPSICKSYFDVGMGAYSQIARRAESNMQSTNSDFYKSLTTEGLQLVENEKLFQFYHLTGTHEFKNDEYCQYSEDATMEQTIKGIFVMLKEYFKQLKNLGVYDNSTIIVTTDHGVAENMQAIFFIKNKQERHEELIINAAPITLNDLRATIVECIGEDGTSFGTSIYDFKEGDSRERFVYERNYDEKYPAVQRYDGKTATQNVYYLYTYTGDRSEYQKMYFNQEYQVIPMIDSYF